MLENTNLKLMVGRQRLWLLLKVRNSEDNLKTLHMESV